MEINSDFDIRIQEYQYLNVGRDSENSDFKAVVKQFSDSEEGNFLADFFEHIVLIEKLRETRVFSGFSRLNSEDGRSLRNRINDLSVVEKDWLPAHVVYGEGIFIKFNDQKIDEWLPTANGNINELITRYHQEQTDRVGEYELRDISPAFILLHTFAHLLITVFVITAGMDPPH